MIPFIDDFFFLVRAVAYSALTQTTVRTLTFTHRSKCFSITTFVVGNLFLVKTLTQMHCGSQLLYIRLYIELYLKCLDLLGPLNIFDLNENR